MARALLLALVIGCSHDRPQNKSQFVPPLKETCYRPAAERFASFLPEGTPLKDGLAKGLVGSLDKEDIRLVIHNLHDDVKRCYEKELLSQPYLSGKVTIQFVIMGDGAVSNSRIDSSTLGSVSVEICAAEQACRWHFPRTKGGGPVVVTYPFVFEPSAPASKRQ